MVYRCMQPPCLNLIRCSSSFDLLEKKSCLSPHSLYNLVPRIKESSKRLSTQTSPLSCVNMERFKASFINILLLLHFYFLANNIKHVNIGLKSITLLLRLPNEKVLNLHNLRNVRFNMTISFMERKFFYDFFFYVSTASYRSLTWWLCCWGDRKGTR